MNVRTRLALAAALVVAATLTLTGAAHAATTTIPGVDFDDSAVVIASGDTGHLVDSVSAGPLAAAQATSVLLTPAIGGLDAQTSGYLSSVRPRVVYIVGGAAAVPAGTETAVTAVDPGAHMYRLAGQTRYGTAVAVAQAVDAMNSHWNASN